MQWLWSLVGNVLPDLTPPEDSDQVAQREADLQRRLSRLSQEVEVMQRVETSEETCE